MISKKPAFSNADTTEGRHWVESGLRIAGPWRPGTDSGRRKHSADGGPINTVAAQPR